MAPISPRPRQRVPPALAVMATLTRGGRERCDSCVRLSDDQDAEHLSVRLWPSVCPLRRVIYSGALPLFNWAIGVSATEL